MEKKKKKTQTSRVRQVVCSKPLKNDRKGGETREEQREVEKERVRERGTDRQTDSSMEKKSE